MNENCFLLWWAGKGQKRGGWEGDFTEYTLLNKALTCEPCEYFKRTELNLKGSRKQTLTLKSKRYEWTELYITMII